MIKYPKTRISAVSEQIFGVTIHDPYRWLEDDSSQETHKWLQKQHELTETVLNEYPDRKDILNRLQDLNNYEKQSCPLKKGAWYYFHKNDGLQNQWVQYRKKSKDSEAELFFDPNTLSEDGTTMAYTLGHDKEYKYFIYRISKAGADAGEIWIMEANSKTWLPDKLLNMRHTGAAWYNDGFYYSSYDADEDYQKQNRNQKIFYHKLGTSVSEDILVYADAEHPLRYNFAWVSDDEKYLFIQNCEGTEGNQILFNPIADETAEFQKLFDGFEFKAWPLDAYEPDCFYVFTNKHAQNYKLLKCSLIAPEEKNWVEIIPERDYLLDSVSIVGRKIFAFYIKDMQSYIEVLDLEGNFLYNIEMPYQGTADIAYVKKEDQEAYFYFSSYVRPYEAYHYDIKLNQMSFFYRYPIKAIVDDIISEQLFFPSKDGTQIPMTLIYKKGMRKNGANPVYLYGYGGFNYSIMPSFNENHMVFLEKGGIVVYVNLRGGGEYGETWHEAGKLLNKQNVFDDFIYAAQFLIKEGYSNPNKIAIAGGSNGGLLIGACMVQRPDLFKVAVPMMGVLDMLRYHKFTCGWGWMTEYGNPDIEQHFQNLLKYSPLHNIQEGVQYPATMVVTADHDDRVIPGHSFKFVATLQEKARQELPILLYTQFKSAHGSSNLTKTLERTADTWTFIFKYLDI